MSGLCSSSLFSLPALSAKVYHLLIPQHTFLPNTEACKTYPLSCVTEILRCRAETQISHISEALKQKKKRKEKDRSPLVEPNQVVCWVRSQKTDRHECFEARYAIPGSSTSISSDGHHFQLPIHPLSHHYSQLKEKKKGEKI